MRKIKKDVIPRMQKKNYITTVSVNVRIRVFGLHHACTKYPAVAGRFTLEKLNDFFRQS